MLDWEDKVFEVVRFIVMWFNFEIGQMLGF